MLTTFGSFCFAYSQRIVSDRLERSQTEGMGATVTEHQPPPAEEQDTAVVEEAVLWKRKVQAHTKRNTSSERPH